MKTSPTLKYSLFIALFFLFSCFPGRISLSILEPAKIALPNSVTGISIFPLAGLQDLPGELDSINNIDLVPDLHYDRIKRSYLEGLAEGLSASPRFKKVVPPDTLHEIHFRNGILNRADLRKLCTRDSRSAVVFLLTAVSVDTLVRYNYPELACGVIYRLINRTRWKIYLPFSTVEIADIPFADTSIFDQENEMCDPHYQMTNIPGIFSDAFHESGMRFAAQISPSWDEDAQRIFFTGPGSRMYRSSMFVYDNQWKEAAEIWNALAEKRNKKIASHASFNLALAWEQDDDLDQAYLWILHADSLLSSGRTLAYKKIIEQRLKNRELLDKQMNNY